MSWRSGGPERSPVALLAPRLSLQRVIRPQGRRDLHCRGLWREVLAGVDEAVGLERILLVIQRAVAAPEREQLLMGTAFDDLAVLQHEDLIGASDRRQPVRDDE